MDHVSGYYIRIHNPNSADIKITPIMNAPRDHYRVAGTALAGGSALYGPNQGTLDFIAHLESGRQFRFAEPPYEIILTIMPNGELWIGEKGQETRHGQGVTFSGVYRRA